MVNLCKTSTWIATFTPWAFSSNTTWLFQLQSSLPPPPPHSPKVRLKIQEHLAYPFQDHSYTPLNHCIQHYAKTCSIFTLLRMISGATYSGVPQNVHVFRPEPIFFAKPKSTYKQKEQLVRQKEKFPGLIDVNMNQPVNFQCRCMKQIDHIFFPSV